LFGLRLRREGVGREASREGRENKRERVGKGKQGRMMMHT
jgi:hypothetical protein